MKKKIIYYLVCVAVFCAVWFGGSCLLVLLGIGASAFPALVIIGTALGICRAIRPFFIEQEQADEEEGQ